MDKKIHKLCMDNAGKNKKLESRMKSVAWENPAVIEYTAWDTPQQNSRVEVVFYDLVNHNAPHEPTYGNEVLTV